MTIKKHFHINSFARKPRFETEAWSSSEMAYLLVLLYTGVTVVRKCSGGRGDSPPATLSICLMPTLSTGVLIARSIVREVIASRCHGGKMSRSQQALVLKIWQEKK